MKLFTSLALLLGLCACGGSPATQNASPHQQSTQLQQFWNQAGTILATQGADLNAALELEHPGTPSNWVYPGAATENMPFDVQVYTVPDSGTGIPCPNNAGGAQQCWGYVQDGAIYVAQSQIGNFNTVGYEMENVILQKLGYNVEGR